MGLFIKKPFSMLQAEANESSGKEESDNGLKGDNNVE